MDLKDVMIGVGIFAAGVLALIGIVAIIGGSPFHAFESGSRSEELPAADEAPLDYAYLDAQRAEEYLGQALNGLPTSEQRTEALTRAVNASLGAATSAQLAGSQQFQQSTVTTITPQAVDRFYTFLRMLRKEGEAEAGKPESCRNSRREHKTRPYWLGEINDQASKNDILNEVKCVGVGNFVRIRNAQLFLPPFAQALPRAQSANAFFGALPAPRTPFTSPVQSAALRQALVRYTKLVGPDPRMPFVAGPFGSPEKVGSGVTFFLPSHYRGITSEPSLLSGSVTIVGKIVYLGKGRQRYIDNPTIFTFGRAFRGAGPTLLRDMGVCSQTPPRATAAVSTSRPHQRPPRKHNQKAARHKAGCISPEAALNDVRASVSFKPPVVVVLPVAIYQ